MTTLKSMSVYVGNVWREPNAELLRLGETFTRSNGTLLARLYERLTKASRRRVKQHAQTHSIPTGYVDVFTNETEETYRQGVYDAYKALQEELS